MVVAQKLKEAELTEQDSLLLTRNLLRIAIFNISYIRGLFPEKYFTDKSVPALEMKIKKLMPMDAESRRLIDWMEKGVYDALQKKYLKTLLFCICETIEGPTIEEYAFSFSYSDSESQEVRMNINRSGTKKGGAFKCDTEITPNEMRSSACKLVRTLVQLMRTLDKMPEERTILMKLLYYDDVTPAEYEPPFFRGCTGEEAHSTWTKDPLKMDVGNVNSKHFVLALKVKSVLDPCEDENDDSQDDTVSLGSDTVRRDDSDSDSEVNHSADGEYMVAPIEKQQQAQDDNCMVDEDDTQDPLEDEHQLARVKSWIISHHLSSVRLSDVLSNLSDISAGLAEDIMTKLVEEGIISKTGKDIYNINNQKTSEYDFPEVKEEVDCQAIPQGGKTLSVDDNMYMKALYHALPMNYVSAGKLQNKLNGEANPTTVRKLIERMVNDGLLESKGNRRLGKRVLHSELTEKKLAEAKRVLEQPERMDIDVNQPKEKSTTPQLNRKGGSSNQADMSTCGGLHSIGSDLTRTAAKMKDATPSNQSFSKTRENDGTPISKTKNMHPVASRESAIPGNDNGGTTVDGEEVDAVICSRSTQERRLRRASTVKEPILQSSKRQRSAL